MKCSIVKLFLLYTVFSFHINQNEAAVTHNARYKRQNIQGGNKTVASTTEEYNPCEDNQYSPKPDFSSLGRRISENKCDEYIWEMHHRAEKAKRESDCIRYEEEKYNTHLYLESRPAFNGEFPHMGAIGWKASAGTWVFKCGSSLISAKFVLTAAHCTSASPKDTSVADPIPKIVRLGDRMIIDKITSITLTSDNIDPKDEKIIRMIIHPLYASPKKYYDIALMELENNVEFTHLIQPACLWTHADTSVLGTKATGTGWGVVESHSHTTSPSLQAAVLDVIDQQLCHKLLRLSNRHWNGLQDHQLCAGTLAGGADACQGDSGGPLQVKIPVDVKSEGSIHFVIGVTSFGIGCGLPNLPGVFTRVSSFIDWIEDIVWRQQPQS